MTRTLISRLHWIFGISAGIVLGVVGLTGAALSFEAELLAWLNRDVMKVAPDGPRLTLEQVLSRLADAYPGREVLSVTVHSAADRALQVTFAEAAAAAPVAQAESGKAPPRRRGEMRYVDPYRGTLLGTKELRGGKVLQTIERTHRGMVAGATGRALVGISSIALVWLALSGLYLRWPRRGALRPGTWLGVNTALRGRAFLWNLHSVIGTWTLLVYLLMTLTGLYFAYEWYRQGLIAMTGAKPPAREAPRLDAPAGGPVDAGRLLAALDGMQIDYESATLVLPPSPEHAAEIRYLSHDAAHERAFDRMALHPRTGAVIKHERFVEKDTASRLLGSMLALHSGEYFGLAGRIIAMLASLAMPVFTVTGWMLYLQRRARKKAPSPTDATTAEQWTTAAGAER